MQWPLFMREMGIVPIRGQRPRLRELHAWAFGAMGWQVGMQGRGYGKWL
jgi:hypothetical protein